MTLEEKRLEVKRLMARDLIENDLPVENEMHPDISMADRLKLTTLDATPEEKKAFIEKKHPGLTVRISNGDIQMKRPESKKWNVLDPSGFKVSDIPADILDVANIPVEGALQIAGGAGGAALGVPAGPIGASAGLIGGSAAGGAAAETLKQYLKKAAGITEDVDTKEILKSAAVSGALAPLLGGAGSSVTKLAAPKAVQNILQRGLVGEGVSKLGKTALPRMAELATMKQVPASSWRTLIERPQVIEEIGQNPTAHVENLATNLLDTAKANRQAIGSEFQQIEKSITPVDLTPAVEEFQKDLFKAQKSASAKGVRGNEALANQVQEFQDALNRLLSKQVRGRDPITGSFVSVKAPIDKTTVSSAYDIKQMLSDEITNNPKDSVSKELNNALIRAKEKVNNIINDHMSETPFKDLNKRYSNALETESKVKKSFGEQLNKRIVPSVSKTENLLDTIAKSNKKAKLGDIQQLGSELGINLQQTAKDYQAAKLLYEPEFVPKFTATSLVPYAPRLAAGLLLGSGWGAPAAMLLGGAMMAGTTPGMVKQYVKAAGVAAKGAKKLYPSAWARGTITDNYQGE